MRAGARPGWRMGRALGRGLVGHAGAILLRKAADQTGLTAQLSAALQRKGSSPLLDRGLVLVSLAVAGKTLTGWLVTDMDATVVTSSSDKAGAAPTWKKGYGFHPLGAWCANTRECLHMLLRPGNDLMRKRRECVPVQECAIACWKAGRAVVADHLAQVMEQGVRSGSHTLRTTKQTTRATWIRSARCCPGAPAAW